MILWQLFLLAILLLLVAGLLAPFESLGWWAGWFGSSEEDRQAMAQTPTQAVEERAGAEQYLVYLSGIGAISGDFLEKEERALLDKIASQVPELVVIGDVFPYSMNNNGLTGQRFFARMWRGIVKLKMENKPLLATFVNLRNVFQVMVCADLRYGPVYNYGTAEVLLDGLKRHGYQPDSGKPVTLLGFSGGVQVALGAATYLQPVLNAPLRIISFGGVMADDPGLMYTEHIYHFYGSKDVLQPLGAIAFAGRWPLLSYSPWNKAKAEGKVSLIPAGPVTHNDPGGYFLAKKDAPVGVETPQDHIHERVIHILKDGSDV